MQEKPSQISLVAMVKGGLALVVVIGVLWAIIAGMAGYTLGQPPTGLSAVASCYHVTRVDFVVPMWKAADPSECSTSSLPSTSICSDPNAPADGNVSGEEACR